MRWLDNLLHRDIPVDLIKGGKGIAGPQETPTPSAYDLDMESAHTSLADMGMGTPHHQGTIGLEYNVLRQMARVPLISAILHTRINQIAEFCLPQKDPYSLGYKIALRESTKSPSRAATKQIQEYTQWWSTCGDPRLSYDDRLEVFVRKIMRDSLIFDQACFEIVKTRGGKVAGLVAVDGSTIRRAPLLETEKEAGRRSWGKTGYVQLLDSKTVAKFTPEEMVFGIRRPRTWIRVNGYGYPELEELVRVISNLLNAEQYNAANFKHGMHAAGILAIKSKMNAQLFRAFRREFYSMLSGASNAHKTPIIQLDPENKEELQNIAMSNNNREMEYDKWISFLLRQATMVYQMDPAELGYQFGNEGQSNTLNSTGTVDKVTYSRERGLRPLMRSVESWFNLVQSQIDDDFVFQFCGFDAKTEKDKLDLDTKAVQYFRTINEVRAMYDQEPIRGPMGEMIMNASYMNTASMMQQQEAEAEEGGEEAAPGEEEAPPDEETPGEDDFNVTKLFDDSAFDFGAPEKSVEKGGLKKGGGIKSITVEVD